MSKKMMIGYKDKSWYSKDLFNEAQSTCDIANAQVIPALKEAEIPITLEAVRSALEDRDYIVEEGVKITLNKPEYRNLPELLRKSVASERAEELMTDINRFASLNGVRVTTTSARPKTVSRKESKFIKLNGETLEVDNDAIMKTREIWIEGDEQCAAFEDYKIAVDALNKLFGGRLPDPKELYILFANELNMFGGNTAKVSPQQFTNKMVQIVTARKNPKPYDVVSR